MNITVVVLQTSELMPLSIIGVVCLFLCFCIKIAFCNTNIPEKLFKFFGNSGD